MYKPKVVLGLLQTGNKSIKGLRQENKDMTLEDLRHLKRAYDLFHGLEIYLTMWDYDKHSCYHLGGWNKGQDKRVMEAMYQLEQDSAFGIYYQRRKDFVMDWEYGVYESSGIVTFDIADVKVLKVVQEEAKEE